MNPFLLMESIASVALSREGTPEHEAGCDTCKAAGGDRDALARLMLEIAELEAKGAR